MQPWRKHLNAGQVIPACPLALHDDGSWSEHHQRALVRYYVEAGAGGLAVGVHSTQFAIRDPQHGLYQPLLKNVSEWLSESLPVGTQFVRIAGICGQTTQATAEAEFSIKHGYHAGLLSLATLRDATEEELIRHCQSVSNIIPIIGFYLQPAVGGRVLSYAFWRKLAENERVVAIKIAPFNRYQTWDVIRAVIDSGREDLALYTGNDDNIIARSAHSVYIVRHDAVFRRRAVGTVGRVDQKLCDNAAGHSTYPFEADFIGRMAVEKRSPHRCERSCVRRRERICGLHSGHQ